MRTFSFKGEITALVKEKNTFQENYEQMKKHYEGEVIQNDDNLTCMQLQLIMRLWLKDLLVQWQCRFGITSSLPDVERMSLGC